MKNLLLLVILLISVVFAHAQGIAPNADLIKTFSERQLLVACTDSQMAPMFNTYVKLLWPFQGQKITFISEREYKKVLLDMDTTFSIIVCEYTNEIASENREIIGKGNFYRIKALTRINYHFKTVFENVFFTRLGELEMKYTFNYISQLALLAKGMAPYNIVGDVAKLRSKTLLVTKEMLDPKLTFEEVQAEYGGNIKVVSPAIILNAIDRNDPDVAFLLGVSSSLMGFPMAVAIDAETLDALAITTVGKLVQSKIEIRGEYNNTKNLWPLVGTIGKRQLKHFLDTNSQAFNRRFEVSTK